MIVVMMMPIIGVVMIMIMVVVMMMISAIVVMVMAVHAMMMISIRVIAVGADPLDMVMMALLGEADLRLEAEHLCAVFAERTVHLVLAFHDFLHPVGEGVQDERMVLQILRLQELDLGMAFRHLIGDPVDALHQHAGEEEIGEDDDAPVAELHRMLQAGAYQREGDAAIADLAPAEA